MSDKIVNLWAFYKNQSNRMMHTDFTRINPQKINENVIRLIGDEWMLITAGDTQKFNTMTASWGHLGVLWNLPTAICYIRPQRYTFEFADKFDYYTLSFFEEKHRDILNFCGAKSGRDYDKIRETGLKPFATDQGNIGYEQARLILECRKLYADDLKEEHFCDPKIVSRNYRKKDFHRFFIGEVVEVWRRK